MPHWSCSSVLCYNNHKTVDQNENKIKKYQLPPTDESIQSAYKNFFKTTQNFNWHSGCGAHWRLGVRPSPEDLPELILPPGHFEILQD